MNQPPVIHEIGRQRFGFPLWLALTLVCSGALLYLGCFVLEIMTSVGSPTEHTVDSTARDALHSRFDIFYWAGGGAFILGMVATFIHLVRFGVRWIRRRGLL